jgi:hypothetical protein
VDLQPSTDGGHLLECRRTPTPPLLYDCVTDTPAGTIRAAAFFWLRNSRIATIRLVFDATLLRQVMTG